MDIGSSVLRKLHNSFKKSKILKEKQWRKQVVIVTNKKKENRKKKKKNKEKAGLQKSGKKTQIYYKVQ